MRIGINGFGRIGRMALRLLMNDSKDEVVYINSPAEAKQLAYLFKYDSMQRTLKNEITYGEDYIQIDNKKIKVTNEKDPTKLNWKEYDVDVVFECTGVFTSKEACMAHINAGAKRVIISAPAKDDAKTIVYGVNDNLLDDNDQIISAASCTTNCLAPVLNLLHKNYKVKSGFMSTVHAITNDQTILDDSHKKGIESRRGRAASINIIPTSTGAASGIGKIIPELNNLLDGNAFRVPVGDGSLLDLTVVVEKKVTKEEVNEMFKSNQNESIKYTEDPIVSSDIVGRVCGAMVDGLLTNVIDNGNETLIKVIAWYDNEVGYTAQMIRTAKRWINK